MSAVRAKATFEVPRLALSVEEAGQAIGVSWDTFNAHVAPEIKMVHLGRRKLVPVSEIERWLVENARLSFRDE